MVGRTVLHYQLIEKLGAGGMGEVYKARDTRLNRFVALKVLPASMSADPECRRRFLQEAQAASALNHPNIITIYDIVADGEDQYMVAEYVAGKTLLELIGKQGLAVSQVIAYASQMAEALSVAHQAHIIHRDLKPANVMVTGGGLVKLLDFGLAKQVPGVPGDPTATTATHVWAPLTMDGSIMGTLNYMSPEQAEGKALDARSDIFSFGAVLYEMLTGQPAFRGDSAISTLSAVLRDEVRPIAELMPGVPPELDQIVGQCLRKDPGERFQSMREVQAALAPLRARSDSGALFDGVPTMRTMVPLPPATRSSKTPSIAIAAFAVLAAAGAGCYWWLNGRGAATSLFSTPTFGSSQSEKGPREGVLTDDNVIEMVSAKVAPEVIISQIRASKTDFDLSAAAVIRLSNASVPPDVIEVMRNPQSPPPRTVSVSATVRDGLPVRLILAQDVPSDVAEGAALRFRVAEDVRTADSVVISRDAPAIGAVVDGGKKRLLVLGGKATFRLESVDAADGSKVILRATPFRQRDGISKRPVSTGAKKPSRVAAAAGAEYTGYVDGAQTVVVKKQR